jgi:hypothetical protein
MREGAEWKNLGERPVLTLKRTRNMTGWTYIHVMDGRVREKKKVIKT